MTKTKTETDALEPKPKYLSITSRTIRFGSRVYQLRNVTNIAMLTIQPTYSITMKGFVISGILFFILMSIDNSVSRLFGLLALAVFGYGIYERSTKKPEYALHLETSSGSQKVISSDDKSFIEKIVAKIYMFMDDESIDSKYVFNLEDRSIKVDKSISVEGDVKESTLLSGDAYDSFGSTTSSSTSSSSETLSSKPPDSRKSSRLKGTGLRRKD